jgi:hypothetical protein
MEESEKESVVIVLLGSTNALTMTSLVLKRAALCKKGV